MSVIKVPNKMSPVEKNVLKLIIIKNFYSIGLLVLAGFLSALGLYSFIYPADFSATGIDGIVTIIHKVTNFNSGVISAAINIPLLIVAWFFLNKKYVIYTLFFNLSHSLFLAFFELCSFYQYEPNKNNVWISVVFSGVILGVRTGIALRVGGSSGGLDIIGSIIQKKRPNINAEIPISICCYAITALSYFVYSNIECLFLSAVHIFVFNKTVTYTMRTSRNAVEVKIITEMPDELSKEIIGYLKHGVTIVPCIGAYTKSEKYMIITLINYYQLSSVVKIAKKYKDSFIFCGDVSNVYGNFRWSRFDDVK